MFKFSSIYLNNLLFENFNKRKSLKPNHGFTIIEVLIAISILVIAFTGMYTVMVSNISTNSYLNQNRIANQLASDIMTNKVKNNNFATLYDLMKSNGNYYKYPASNFTRSEFPALTKLNLNTTDGIKLELLPVTDNTASGSVSPNMINAKIQINWKTGKKSPSISMSTVITNDGTNSDKVAFNSTFVLPVTTPAATPTPVGATPTPTPVPTPTRGNKENGEQCNSGMECKSGVCRLGKFYTQWSSWDAHVCTGTEFATP